MLINNLIHINSKTLVNLNKKDIINRINKLTLLNNINNKNDCFKKIFKLICKNKYNYIINNNGIIFNILEFDDNSI